MKTWIFSILTAFIAYFFGSLSTMVLASNFVFRSNLRRLGKDNAWLSNFRRVHGVKGFLKLALVEIVKDVLPLLLGGLLFSSGGNAAVGRALAAFCLAFGRMYPGVYGFRGSYASAAIAIGALFISPSLGAAALLVCVLITWATGYLSLGTLAGAVVAAVAAVLVLDNTLCVRLCFFIAVLTLVRTLPSISRIAAHKEERLRLEEDISYKFDEKF